MVDCCVEQALATRRVQGCACASALSLSNRKKDMKVQKRRGVRCLWEFNASSHRCDNRTERLSETVRGSVGVPDRDRMVVSRKVVLAKNHSLLLQHN